MQAWQNTALSSGSSGIQAAQQAGEPDESQHPDSLVHFSRHRVLQAFIASIIADDKHNLQGIIISAYKDFPCTDRLSNLSRKASSWVISIVFVRSIDLPVNPQSKHVIHKEARQPNQMISISSGSVMCTSL